jgi:dipeptidyl aminopeptidase/acylaminoacyl peptidase
MNETKIERQFGLWDSPISPISLARGISFSDVAWNQDGTLVWREERSDRGVIVLQPSDDQAPRDLNSDHSVRARVGYGGGDFAVGFGNVYFADAESSRLYRQPLKAGIARPVTPAFGNVGSPVVSPNGQWLLYVHTYEREDSIAVVDVEGNQWPVKLVFGDDFYMQPCWHPGGRRIAWVAWNHPNMPWDGTLLQLGELSFGEDKVLRLKNTITIAGDEDTSIYQPVFSPDGAYLAYVSDQTGWWQLYLCHLESGDHRQLTHELAEHGGPAWVQGLRVYAFAPDGKRLFFLRNQGGVKSLWQLDIDSGDEGQIPLGDYTSLKQIALSHDGDRVALIASGGSTPTRVITCTPSGDVSIIRRATAEDLPAETYSSPQHIAWQGMDGGEAYGLFYQPRSDSFKGMGLPPLIVLIHGGPTSQRVTEFNIGAQFFTSRGYAVLDVNYRGSTGYGRVYRNKLRGNWGVYDVQDAVSGARFLAEQGKVDKSRLVIMGGSAGGFTVLKALEDYPGFFKAGVCLYGVSNQFTLVAETHKFEEHYSDTLLGSLPEAADLYRERSPIFYMDKIQDPIIIFQGEEDVVVPRSQSDEVVESLKRRGVPHEYHLYPGEGHGFRKIENIEHLYKTIDKFLRGNVIFS